jgi:hypothetical protein
LNSTEGNVLMILGILSDAVHGGGTMEEELLKFVCPFSSAAKFCVVLFSFCWLDSCPFYLVSGKLLCFGLRGFKQCCYIVWSWRVFWDVAPSSHIEVVRQSEGYCLHHQGDDDGGSMSVGFNLTTWRYIPEDSILRTHHCENVKSHNLHCILSPPPFDLRSFRVLLGVCCLVQVIYSLVTWVQWKLFVSPTRALKQRFPDSVVHPLGGSMNYLYEGHTYFEQNMDVR